MDEADRKLKSKEGLREARVILGRAPDFLTALRNLLNQRKSQKPYSFKQLAVKLGLKSSGYISDVIQGKKKLGRQHLEKLAKALKLGALEAEYLNLLWDKSYSEDQSTLHETSQQLLEIKRVFELSAIDPLAKSPHDIHFCLLVNTAFSLFKGKAKLSQIKALFAKSQALAVEQAIHDLKQMGALVSNGEFLEAQDQSAFYNSSQDGKSHLRFFQSALDDSMRQIRDGYESFDDSYFVSTFISVNKKSYEEKLEKIKRQFFQTLASLEEPNDSNQVVSFNVQIFPKLTRPDV